MILKSKGVEMNLQEVANEMINKRRGNVVDLSPPQIEIYQDAEVSDVTDAEVAESMEFLRIMGDIPDKPVGMEDKVRRAVRTQQAINFAKSRLGSKLQMQPLEPEPEPEPLDNNQTLDFLPTEEEVLLNKQLHGEGETPLTKRQANVMAYQSGLNLTPDGLIGPNTYKAMLDTGLTEKQADDKVKELYKGRIFAHGRYQTIPQTTRATLDKAGLSIDDKATPENQDKLVVALIENLNGFKEFKKDHRKISKAMDALSSQFESLPNSKGQGSYVKGRVKAKPQEVRAALNKARGGNVKPLLDLIAKYESGGSGGYNAYNSGTYKRYKGDKSNVVLRGEVPYKLTEMTYREILEME
jgi:hypothetical protein